MATYNLRDVTPSRLSAGDIINLPARIGDPGRWGTDGRYGGSFSVNLPKGRYLLECWGSSSNTSGGGTGGYAKGVLDLQSQTTAILTAGGWPFNGGHLVGTFEQDGYSQCSGGASDIRLINNDLLNRVIVAGGGGSGGEYLISYNPIRPDAATYGVLNGGNGGGPSGGDTKDPNGSVTEYTAKGGTQTSGGKTGKGYTTSNHWYSDGKLGEGGGWYGNYQLREPGQGGGGWYGGGGGGTASASIPGTWMGDAAMAGGGGSGFVFTSSTARNVPSGYALGSAYYLSDAVNISGHETPLTNPDGTVSAGHIGEGYVRITVISIFNGIYIGSNAGKALAVKGIYIGDSNGKARRVVKGYIGDSNGKAKRFL